MWFYCDFTAMQMWQQSLGKMVCWAEYTRWERHKDWVNTCVYMWLEKMFQFFMRFQWWAISIHYQIIMRLTSSNPCTCPDRPWGVQEVETPRLQDNRHMKVVRLSALWIGHHYPTGNILGIRIFYRLCRPLALSAAWRITYMENFNDTTRVCLIHGAVEK